MERRRIVTIESPYRNPDRKVFERNVRYARAALRHSIMLGESPLISHLLYTQQGVLNDNVECERNLGIDAGIALKRVADATVVYADLGISEGMQKGIEAAQKMGQPVCYRGIGNWMLIIAEHYAAFDPVIGSLLNGSGNG